MPSAKPQPEPATAPRREAWEQSRASLLEGARVIFGARGYNGTATKDVAAAAGVAERTLFRHFPTKADLFREAVIEPFGGFVQAYIAEWQAHPAGSRTVEEEVRGYYEGLLEVLEQHGKLLVALIAAQTFGSAGEELGDDLKAALGGLLGGLEPIAEREGRLRGLGFDPTLVPRIMFGIVVVIQVHGDWLFDGGTRPDRARLLDELTMLTVYGLTGPR